MTEVELTNLLDRVGQAMQHPRGLLAEDLGEILVAIADNTEALKALNDYLSAQIELRHLFDNFRKHAKL